MIGFLNGRLLRSSPERVLVDVGGVGYDVHVPLSTYYEIERAGAHGEVRLYVHTHVRDDGIVLYGFWSEREQQLFEKLLSVNGIGPRGAQVVLSGLAAAIPAVIGYNYFVNKVRHWGTEMDNFALELANMIERRLVRTVKSLKNGY